MQSLGGRKKFRFKDQPLSFTRQPVSFRRHEILQSDLQEPIVFLSNQLEFGVLKGS